ncbi:MAG: TonB-dependent receptor plug domain-containing protein [Puniceicoccaceae bacterium]
MRQKLSKTTFAILASGLVAFSLGLSAQDEDDDNIFELSPFVVDTSEDVGYLATTTLAGSRLNMQLRDVGSAVSVMTEEFMEDTGATNANTLLSYGLNTEVAAGDQGNYAAASVSADTRQSNKSSRLNPQGGQRIRGLASATLTRDYFLTSIPFDKFNTSQVTVSRGPNSLLFGIGSPGGVINSGIKQAMIGNDFGEVSVRIGERESYRVSLDYNKVLVDDRLAIRIAALDAETNYQQKPAYENSDRYFIAVNAVLAKNDKVGWLGETILRGNFEDGNIKGTPVNTIPLFDAMSSWFGLPDNVDEIRAITGTTPAPFEANYQPKWTVDNSTGAYPAPDLENFGPNRNAYWEHLPVVYNDPSATESTVGLPNPAIDGVLARVQWAKTPDEPDWGRADLIFSESYFGQNRGGGSALRAPGFSYPNIIDTNVYDNRKMLLAGTSQWVNHYFDVKNLRLEQTFWDNRAGIEFAYNKEAYEREEHMPMTNGHRQSIFVDLNEKLSNGKVNPNLGRPMMFDMGTDDRHRNLTDREAYQATAFYNLDFSENDGWTKWFGRHVLTGFLGTQRIDNTTYQHRAVMEDLSPATDIRSYQNNKLHAWRRNIPTVVYLGPSMLGSEYQSLSDVVITDYWRGRTPQTGDIVTVEYQTWTPTYKGPEFHDDRFFTADFGIQEYLINGGRSRREIDSEVFSVQSNWLKDHIVTVLGWRTDTMTDTRRVQNSVYNEINPETSNFRYPSGEMDAGSFILGTEPEDITSQSGNTFTASIVGHVPKNWLKLPYDSTISFHFNESENFSASGVRRNVYTEIIPAPTGETTEYGLTVHALEDRLSIRMNWFETSNLYSVGTSVGAPGWIGNGMNRWRDAETGGMTFEEAMALNTELTGVDVSHLFSGYQDIYDLALSMLPPVIRDRWEGWDEGGTGKFGVWTPNAGQGDSQDFVAKGFEVDIVGSITRNWTVALNIAEQETITSNSSPASSEFAFTVAENIANSPLQNMIDSPNLSEPQTWSQRWLRSAVNPMVAALAKDGQVSQEQRKWRINFVNNYTFSDGRLKGLQLGGAVRWQDKVATGYEIEVTEDGRVLPFIDRPFYGEDELGVDLWVKYSKALTDKIDWMIQVNIRNAYQNNDEFIPIVTNPDGRHAIYRNANPQEIFVTNTFKF